MQPSTAKLSQNAKVQAVSASSTEETLRASLAMLQQVVNCLPQAIGWTDQNTVFLGCNQVFAQAAGFAHPAEIVGQAASDLQWYGQPAPFFHGCDRPLTEPRQAEYHQLEASPQTGQPVWLAVSQMPLYDESGAVGGVMSVVEDVTDRQQAEAALRRSETTNRALINAVPNLLFRIHRDGTYLDIQSSKNFKVINSDQLTVGTMVSNSLPSASAQQRMHYVQQALSTGELQIYEQELLLDGMPKHEEVRIVPCQENEVLAMVRDISDRKQAEKALHLAQFSVEYTSDTIFWLRPDAKIIYANRAACQSLGYTADELRSLTVFDIDVAFPPAAWADHWQQLRQQGSFTLESTHRAKDGRVYPVEVIVSFFALEGDEYNFVRVREISERKRAEAFLRESEQQMREQAYRERLLNRLLSRIRDSLDFDTILENTLQEVQNFTRVDRCQFAWYDPNCEESHWEIVKETRCEYLPSLVGRYPLSPRSPLLVQLLDQQSFCIEDVEALPESSLRRFAHRFGYRAMLTVPIRMQSGLWGALFCCHTTEARTWTENEVDLIQAVMTQLAIALTQAKLYTQSRTKAQELEQALRELQKTQTQMVQSEKMSSLGQLVAGVAHEINNPVNFIYGNLNHADRYIQDLLHLIQLYQQHYPNPAPHIQAEADAIDLDFLLDDLPKLLSSMKVGADRIQKIVLSLRNFSRTDEAEVKQVDIHEGIDSTLMILQSRLKGKAGELKVIKQYGQLPLVECYPGQLNQVFMNLLSNAIDALEESAASGERSTANAEPPPHRLEAVGDRSPSIRIQTEQLNNGAIAIKIADNGCGMTQAQQQRLFDPFFTTKPVGKGTGLGLSISYQIVVEKHGGSLTCLSVPGEGAEFCITIPTERL